MEFYGAIIDTLTLFVLFLTYLWIKRYTIAAEDTRVATNDLARTAARNNELTSRLAEAAIDPAIIVVADDTQVNKYYAENIGKSVAIDISLEETDSEDVENPDIELAPVPSLAPGTKREFGKRKFPKDQSSYNETLKKGREFRLQYFNIDQSATFSMNVTLYHKDCGQPQYQNFKRESYAC